MLLPLQRVSAYPSVTFAAQGHAFQPSGLPLPRSSNVMSFVKCAFRSKRRRFFSGRLQRCAETSTTEARENVETVIQMPSSGPFQDFETFGWSHNPKLSLDENLLSLAYAGRYNCYKVAGYTGGRCSAMICHPPRLCKDSNSVKVEVVGFGINSPPRFAPAPEGFARVRNVEAAGIRPNARRKRAYNEIHSEMQVIARCARRGISMKGLWMYVALPPCWECCKAIIAAGVARVVFRSYTEREKIERKDKRQKLHAQALGISWVECDVSREQEEYVENLWKTWKKERSLDHASLKALASERPV
eukprot:TRINITY_DN13372_c0_g1_i2.p1 TRINITY_DN13372_c0_g1~~TRINITY_DN13372_c0_g1_i2.p1  ORF type:complete len:302 (-),score=46.73 TRINITY_DN13372_c0_g1_i2:203-1108(-)